MTVRVCKASYMANVRNISKQWTEGALGGYILETTANSMILAMATELHFKIIEKGFQKSLLSVDNGIGMVKRRFQLMPDIGVDEEIERRPDDVNCFHEGIKGIFDHAEQILVETKSNRDGNFYGSGKWWKDESERDPALKPKFDDNYTKRKIIPTETGTAYEIFLTEWQLKQQLTKDYIKTLLIQYYSPMMLGYYGNKSFFINDEKVEIGDLKIEKETEFHEDFITEIREKTESGDTIKKKQKIHYHFMKSSEPLSEELRGVHIVVGGRIILNKEDYFKIQTDFNDNICAIICVDFLVYPHLKRDKTGFMRSVTTDDTFKAISMRYKEWIDDITETEEKPEKDETGIKMEQKINLLLRKKKWEKLKELLGKKMTDGTLPKRPCSVCGTTKYTTAEDPAYYICENGHTWLKRYTWKRPDPPKGNFPTVRKFKKWINYNDIDKPTIISECWFYKDEESNEATVIINKAMTTYKNADKNKQAKEYHIARCISQCLLDNLELNDEERNELFFDLFQDLIS